MRRVRVGQPDEVAREGAPNDNGRRSRVQMRAEVSTVHPRAPASDEWEEYVQRAATRPLTSAIAVVTADGQALSRIVQGRSQGDPLSVLALVPKGER
jgi:hypothetical protein